MCFLREETAKCLEEKKLSHLTGLPYLLWRDNSPFQAFRPPREELAIFIVNGS